MKQRIRRPPPGIQALVAGACLVLGLPSSAGAQVDLGLDLPLRSPEALAGSEVAARVRGLDLAAREAVLIDEILSGNVPSWLRTLVPVRLNPGADDFEAVTIFVFPDYLAVGGDADFVRMPLSPGAAQSIADSLRMSLPTTKMVDAVWRSADVRLTPSPIPPSEEMTTVPVFVVHDRMVGEQAARRGWRQGRLLAGHKKDVVLFAGIADRPGRVAIYGWHEPDGQPIQPLYSGHLDSWVDYSHGIRLIDRRMSVGDSVVDLGQALREPRWSGLLSNEGPLPVARYPTGR